MSEWRLFPEGTIPEYTTPAWYEGRDAAPHLEQYGHQRDRLLVSAGYVFYAAGHGSRDVVDVGCGDGGLLSLVQALPSFGFDLQQTNVDSGQTTRGVDVRLLDVVADWPRDLDDQADTVVCTEMLEHLIDPHDFVRRIADTRARWVVASSPRLETPENHYEFHTWAFDTDGYPAMFAKYGWTPVALAMPGMFQVWLFGR